MSKQTYQQAVEKVVNFWIEKSFKTLFNQNNGDDTPSGGVTFALMNLVSSSVMESVNDEKIEKFKTFLTQSLLEIEHQHRGNATLYNDYHPEPLLAKAAEHAEIDTACFPCKTCSWIDENNVATASYQYGGSIQTL